MTFARSLVLVSSFGFTLSTQSLAQTYPLVSTMQDRSYDDRGRIIQPLAGERFFGQDAQAQRTVASYTAVGDLVTRDNVTGLSWTRSADAAGDGNGQLTWDDKVTFAQAQSRVAELNATQYGGYCDWRLPSVKELYSLIDFRGRTGTTAANARPYIDAGAFAFNYGDTTHGERYIDSQYWSATQYVSTTMNNAATAFGVNFADGRIKGYPQSQPTPESMGGPLRGYAMYVRGNTSYGQNAFVNNNDGTITDAATSRMWSRDDSVTSVNWEQALAWVQQKNAENYLGYSDWRLPDAKELESLVDYTRSPATTNSAAIDPMFNCTPITDALGRHDFATYWSSTTHLDGPEDRAGDYAIYVAFGRAQGWMETPPGSGVMQLLDVHGAGAQRSDPKSGNPQDYPFGFGPQGDVIGIYNKVRLVRTVPTPGSTGAAGAAVLFIALRRRRTA